VRHAERHHPERIGWLRAAVLGANDGIVSTASLILGVAAAGTTTAEIITAGGAGLVAGAMSMAAGEYVSVSSQADSEEAELAVERRELATDLAAEHTELERIYVKRGLEPELARQVAEQLMARDALAAHARDELGIVESQRARPLLASLSSAAAFSVGAALPLGVTVALPRGAISIAVVVASLLSLTALGAVAARVGGARMPTAAVRVLLWGAAAMAVTYGVGAAVGRIV
jgi:VIT1/CCC1 family predicted Fe2+/Mn2+ transporter